MRWPVSGEIQIYFPDAGVDVGFGPNHVELQKVWLMWFSTVLTGTLIF